MTRDYRWLLIGAEHARGPQPQPPLQPQPVRPPLAPRPVEGEDVEYIRLFARGDESIRFVIRPATRTLRVFGPGRVQKVHEFTSAIELETFLTSYEQRLLDTDWALLDVADRRISGRG